MAVGCAPTCDVEPVHDGDTVRLELDLGFNQTGVYPLRLKDVMAPELKQPGGPESRDFTRAWLAGQTGNRWPFVVETFRTRTGSDLTTLERYVAVVHDAAMTSTLNDAVRLWLAEHPAWPGGVGSGR